MRIDNSQNVVKHNKNIVIFNDSEKSNGNTDFRNVLQDKLEELQANIKAGNVDFDPVFQIGGKAYTQEEWKKLLKYVDEVEAETQEAIEIEQEQVKEDIYEE